VLASILAIGCSDEEVGTQPPPPPPSKYRVYADRAMAALEKMYLPTAGRFGFRWWNSATALETTIDYLDLTGSDQYAYMIANTFDLNSSDDFLNEYYDDEGWWGLAWIKAYDRTKDARYLQAAKIIFDDMVTGWDEVCGGGVWWRKDRDYKNAIPNELFLQLAARLYVRTREQPHLDWTNREWAWFDASGMINAESLVNDGLTAECANNGQTAWSYNQGVILGGLVELAEITGARAYVARAEAIADAAVRSLVNEEGILVEPCEPDCGNDGAQFKGIFVRNLSRLYDTSPKPDYRDFILRNAEAMWERARNEEDQIGLMWAGPFDSANAATQSSALDALNAAARIEP
jgi:predicted alpha-1,6-mannanase (GH76 family)